MSRQLLTSILLTAAIAVCVCLFCVGYGLGSKSRRNAPICLDNIRVDTLILRDTIMQIRPVSVSFRAIDTISVPIKDTVMVSDTVFVNLTREQVVWRDSLSEVYASGVMPSVDSVIHYRTAEVRTVTLPPVEVPRRTRWGIGVQAGYGAALTGGQIKAVPYIGVGVSYNIFTW